MSSIGKVHLNGSTVLSLNDRFTIMQKQSGSSAPATPRPRHRPQARSRSRSRSGLMPHIAAAVPISPRTTLRNHNLLQQLDQKHKMRVALKLKRKSMNLKPQNTIGVRGRRRMIRPSAALINTPNTRKRLRRSQSVATNYRTNKNHLRHRMRQAVGQIVRNQSRPRNNNQGIRRRNNQGNQQRGPNNRQRNQRNPRNQQQSKRGGRQQQTRGRPQKKSGQREPPKSKEQLDAELDQYMVNTKSNLDQEMGIYTN